MKTQKRVPAAVLALAAVCLGLSSCDPGTFEVTYPPPPDPGGYWICGCAGWACFYYPDCYWVSTAATGAALLSLEGLSSAQAAPVEITIPASGDEVGVP